MSDTTALSAAPPPSPGPTPRVAVARAAADEMDLYSETPNLGTRTADSASVENWFGKDGFDFKDLLDIVNPLQHLPVISTLYRALTDDTLEPGPRILGGTLFGGIAGFVSSIANAVYENETGKDIGATALALITGDSAPATAVATAAPSAATTSATATAPPTATAAPAHAAGAITPTAPSPLALAGHAKAPGLPLAASAAANENAVSALLNARAAVPATHSAAATGLPATNYRSSLKMPDGRTVPIQFKQRVATADARDAHAATPAAEKAVATAMAQHGATGAVAGPRPLHPAAGTSNPAAAQGAEKAAAGTVQADVPVLMRQALDKYESLMKSRTNPSISGQI
jgi:hypothetical protein